MYGNCSETAPVAKGPRPSPECPCARLRRGTAAGNLKVRTARDYGAERNGSEPYARLRCGTGSEGGEGTVHASYVVRFVK